MPRSYRAEIEKLAKLATFDARAFVAEDKSTQDCCDFVLALAVAFNDIKDLLLADSLLIGEAPHDKKTPTRELGAFGGLHVHFLRVLLGVLHELLCVVKRETSSREHPLFQEVLRKLPQSIRSGWEKIVAASEAHTSADPDIHFLVQVRNTVAYHYGKKAIGQGYRYAFASGTDAPFVSRGSSISTTRFYFADGAVHAYMKKLFGDDVEQFFLQNPHFLNELAAALASIVDVFVKTRGYAWREPALALCSS